MSDTHIFNLGDLIYSHRKTMKISRQKFGNLIGVEGNTIYNWEVLGTTPHIQHVVALISPRVGMKSENIFNAIAADLAAIETIQRQKETA